MQLTTQQPFTPQFLTTVLHKIESNIESGEDLELTFPLFDGTEFLMSIPPEEQAECAQQLRRWLADWV